jgi:hypothetical protein
MFEQTFYPMVIQELFKLFFVNPISDLMIQVLYLALHLCFNLFLLLFFELQCLFYDLPMFFDLDPILVLQTFSSLHNLSKLHTTTLKLVLHPLAHISPFFVIDLQFVLHSHLPFVDLQFAYSHTLNLLICSLFMFHHLILMLCVTLQNPYKLS